MDLAVMEVLQNRKFQIYQAHEAIILIIKRVSQLNGKSVHHILLKQYMMILYQISIILMQIASMRMKRRTMDLHY